LRTQQPAIADHIQRSPGLFGKLLPLPNLFHHELAVIKQLCQLRSKYAAGISRDGVLKQWNQSQRGGG
jgi:hypothetical protein